MAKESGLSFFPKSMTVYRALSLFLFVACCPVKLFSQNYRVESFNMQSGLLSNHVIDIDQAQNGIVWILTDRGVALFDGVHFYNHRDSSGLFPISSNSRIKAISSNEVVVVGINSASRFVFKYFKENKWHDIEISNPVKVSQRIIWDAVEYNNQLILKCAIGTNLFSYSDSSNSWNYVPLPVIAECTQLLINDNKAMILTRAGVFKETPSGWEKFDLDKYGFKNVYPVEMVVEKGPNPTTWLLGDNWLASIKNGKAYTLIKKKENSIEFRELKQSGNGFLFFRSSQTFYWYHKQSGIWRSFLPIGDEVGARDSHLLIDKEDGLWINGYRGLYHIPSFQFSSFDKSDGFLNSEVSFIKELQPYVYLLGFPDGYGILKNDSLIFTQDFPKGNGRLINAVKGPNNRIYIAGSNLGVGELLPNYKISWINKEITADMIAYLKDTLWAVDRIQGLLFFKNHKFHKKCRLNGYTRNISIASNGDMILCTSNGIYNISNAGIIHSNMSDDLTLKQVYCAFTLDSKTIFGTAGGFASLDGQTLKKTDVRDINLNVPIYAVIEGDNELWFGTDNGIYKLKNGSLTHYDESNALLGWEVNRAAFIKDSKGRLLIGTNKGLNIYDTLHSTVKSLQFKPLIKSIKSTSKTLDIISPITLGANDNSLVIGLQAITFSGKPVEFRYRMIGFENEWRRLISSDIREVTYSVLPSGNFRFEMQARISESVWSESVWSPAIYIETPFYRTYLFVFLSLMTAGAIGYSIRWFVTSKRLSKQLKNEIQLRTEELRASETKLGVALENSRMGVWIYNINSDSSEYSSELSAILGLPQNLKSLNKAYFLSMVHQQDRKKVILEFSRTVKRRNAFDFEVRYMHDGNVFCWLNIKGRAVYDSTASPHLLSGTISDISLRKKQEADRENMISELEKTNSELDRFVYSVSHDLSAPIKSIQGLINLAKMDPGSQEVLNYLNLIEKSINRQNDFIKEIIEFGRNARMPVKLEQVDVIELINSIIEDLKYSETFSGTEIILNIDQGSRLLECDRIRLKIILNNLLSNAVKFKSKNRNNHFVIVSISKPGEPFVLTIEDNGIGIEEKHLKYLFSMFYRATDQQPGSGIGLYIAFEAAKKMLCKIEVSSKEGYGSKFMLKKLNGTHLP